MEETNLPLSQPHPAAASWPHWAHLCAWCTGAAAAEHFHFPSKDPLEAAGMVDLSTGYQSGPGVGVARCEDPLYLSN